MIYNTKRQRDRLILELQARCGLRIGELLKIKVSDVSDRTITLREPNQAKRLKGPTCQRMYRGNYRNTSKGEIFKEKSGYFPSVIRLLGLLSEDWEPN
jgi:integrase